MVGGTIVVRLGLLLACCSIPPSRAVKVGESNQTNLYDKLLNGNIKVRPVRDWAKPVIVHVSFILVQVKELNSVEQTLDVAGLMSMFWMDEFMSWNQTEYGIERILLPATSVWTPEFSVYNSADGIYRDKKWWDYDVMLLDMGVAIWQPSGLFSVSCRINILKFPFDTQTCLMTISNWLEEATTGIDFYPANDKVITSYYMENSEWILKDTSVYRHHNYIPGMVDSVSINILFTLKRRHQAYILTIILPLMFVSLLGLLAFVLPPESGEKVSLGVTILLAFSVFQLLISENLPKSSEVIPFIMVYVVFLMAMNAVSIAMTILVLHFHHKNPAPRMPSWMRKFILGFLATICCDRLRKNKVEPEQQQEKVWPEREDQQENLMIVEELEKRRPENGVMDDVKHVMMKLLKEVRKITTKMADDQEQEDIMGEWKRAAGVLDRFFFIVTGSLLLIATAAFAVMEFT